MNRRELVLGTLVTPIALAVPDIMPNYPGYDSMSIARLRDLLLPGFRAYSFGDWGTDMVVYTHPSGNGLVFYFSDKTFFVTERGIKQSLNEHFYAWKDGYKPHFFEEFPKNIPWGEWCILWG